MFLDSRQRRTMVSATCSPVSGRTVGRHSATLRRFSKSRRRSDKKAAMYSSVPAGTAISLIHSFISRAARADTPESQESTGKGA
eukprot:2735172-Amphidinium_carterae.1